MTHIVVTAGAVSTIEAFGCPATSPSNSTAPATKVLLEQTKARFNDVKNSAGGKSILTTARSKLKL